MFLIGVATGLHRPLAQSCPFAFAAKPIKTQTAIIKTKFRIS
jgi:hypothetical protein